jgi:hypothetical protein
MKCFNTEELSKSHPGDEDIMLALKAKQAVKLTESDNVPHCMALRSGKYLEELCLSVPG